MELQPLGDRAILASLPDESSAFAFAEAVRAANRPWLQDVVPAYSTVGVFFDAERVRFAGVRAELEGLEAATLPAVAGILHRIPVCYERQLDLPRVIEATGLPADEVIRLHTGSEFRIYAIGFVPGFPYMGYLPQTLAGVPRLPSPRMKLEPGSVGITGRQTGIYPLARPGGWNILGQTPLTIVDVEDGYFPLDVGDRVRFERIDEAEFQRLLGERL
jgi:inhibitor of KinA